MPDKEKPREGQVISGSPDMFRNVNGGRSNYGALIMKALTGLGEQELIEAAVAQLPASNRAAFKKEIAENGEISATLLDAEDQFFMEYTRMSGGPAILAASIAPERLERLVAENNALEPCIAAMVTNISCTGYRLVLKGGNEADITEERKTKRAHIEEFFNEVSPRKSMLRVRKELRRDLHTTGNSYAVIERTITGELAFVKRAPAKSMRMVQLDAAVPVTITMMRGGKEVTLTTSRSERRFVQKIGTKLVYYKEFGASRDLDRTTGKWASEGTKLPAAKRAHEVIHEKDIEDVKSPYGIPRWLPQLPSVLGSRLAEEYNLAFFHSGGVPPVMIFIGGLISEPVQKAIDSFLSGGASDKQRRVAIEIPSGGDLDKDAGAKVTVEKFGSQDADSTFEVYDEKCEKRVRRSFRLPGIFLGMADSYNFASAHASYVVAEAQVFSTERDEEDESINMTIMREIDDNGDFVFTSNPLTVQDVNIQLKAIQMATTMKGISIAELAEQLSTVANVDITVSEDYRDTIVGVDDGDENEGNTPADGPNPEPGATPPATPATPTGASGDAPTPPIQSNKRSVQLLAASIGRNIRDYDDTENEEFLKMLVGCQEEYEVMSLADQASVDQHLAPIMYTSTFLHNAALSDVAAAYAQVAFNDAKRLLETENA